MGRITKDNLFKIFPKTNAETLASWVDPLNATCERYDITTAARTAAFVAQIGHESGEMKRIVENLNYSTEGLMTTFKKYFPNKTLADKYARRPEHIANLVYANRMGNGPESTGDGWKYRGRGLIQITGKNNYAALAKALGMTITQTLAFLDTKEGAAHSAGWFWSVNNLNGLADMTRFTEITKKINGGTHGLDDRKRLWNLAKYNIK